MSHRKRVRAYWNKRAAAERMEKLRAALNGFFKAKYAPSASLVPEWGAMRSLLSFDGQRALHRDLVADHYNIPKVR